MGLTGCVLNNGAALSESCGDDDIHGSAHGNLVQIHAGTVELTVTGLGVDKTVSNLNLCTQRSHTLYMLVNGADAEVAAAGHSGLCRAEAAQHCADKVIGSPYLTHEIIGGVAVVHVGAVDLHGGFIDKPDLCAKLPEYGEEHIGIAYLGHILNAANAINKKSCRNNGHSRVFCAADLYFAAEFIAAVYNIFFHDKHLSITSGESGSRLTNLG